MFNVQLQRRSYILQVICKKKITYILIALYDNLCKTRDRFETIKSPNYTVDKRW